MYTERNCTLGISSEKILKGKFIQFFLFVNSHHCDDK